MHTSFSFYGQSKLKHVCQVPNEYATSENSRPFKIAFCRSLFQKHDSKPKHGFFKLWLQ